MNPCSFRAYRTVGSMVLIGGWDLRYCARLWTGRSECETSDNQSMLLQFELPLGSLLIDRH